MELKKAPTNSCLPCLRLDQKELFFVFSLAFLSGNGQRAYAGAQDLRICLDNKGIWSVFRQYYAHCC